MPPTLPGIVMTDDSVVSGRHVHSLCVVRRLIFSMLSPKVGGISLQAEVGNGNGKYGESIFFETCSGTQVESNTHAETWWIM